MATALATALALTAGPAGAQTPAPTQTSTQAENEALRARLIEIREQCRFLPEKALAALAQIAPELAGRPGALQADLLTIEADGRMRQGRYDDAMVAAEKAIALGRELHDDAIVAKAQLTKVYVLFARADVEAAHQLAFEAEKLAMRTNNAAVRAQATITAGQTHAEQGNFPAALVKLQQAVEIARGVTSDPPTLAAALNALTRLLVQMKEFDQAAASLDELLAESAKLNSPGRMSIAKNAEYWLTSDTGQMQRAMRALRAELELERKMGAERMATTTLVNLADLHLKLRDYPRAAQYAHEALQVTQRNNDQSTEATARVNLGNALLAMGRIAEGKRQFEAGMARYEKENNKPELQLVMREYGVALENAGDLAGALAAYHRERALSDELFERQRQKSMLELQEKYETDKKERQIELLSRENQLQTAELDNRALQQRLWWLLALVFALAAVVVGLLYRKVRHSYARLEEKNLELKAQSTLDPLTSLYNRRHFQDYMRTLAPVPSDRHGQRGDDVVGALFLLDVDHFKHINDSYGHAAGDAVLTAIADNLRIVLRETDMIVRWGGEEFLAFLPAVARDDLDDIARRILHGISAQRVSYQEQEIAVNVSVGFAPYPLAPGATPLPWERAVNLVDMALYLAKAHGRNRAYGVRGFALFERTSMEAIEQDLERAWRDGYVDLSVVLSGAPEAPPPSQDNVVRLQRAGT
ncbi:diguanylate cyclase (GGDEF)-like protein [Duganella sp. 3397]|uniref:tetratricopeptide repeat-containing diguanylate cyclase n=1 Tax=Duganella sp. 3397 TaxID=2817732 RepID=UPI0028594C7B|nr:diguanylate cyclase [Duganella sp. 3397]MDR7052264.1 diguanylate cyclase (GGDEF)-like protein [Duganella sp. 3397]